MRRLPAVLVACAWLTSAAAYRSLPDSIPPHVSTGGGDWWLGRPLLVSMLPLVATLTWVLFRWFPRHDTLRASYPRFAWSCDTVLVVVLLTIVGLHVAVLSAAFARAAWMGRAVAALVGAALVAIGNELPKFRPNWLWGIRTPWTLGSPRVWQRTHRVAGYVAVLGGLVVLLATIAKVGSIGSVIGAVVATGVAALVILSYVLWRRERRGSLCVVLVAITAPAAHGQTDRLGNRPLLERFVDSVVTAEMQKGRVPGVAVAVVKDGGIALEKGYGLADLESQSPVDARTTLFRVASVSKPFTAAAVLQLVEQGRLALDQDVNRYLGDFQLSGAPWRAITLHDLLTHTAGLDERLLWATTRSARGLEPLGRHLARRMPRRVMAPGEVQSYSNYGYALAGYVVERASGVPFAEYARHALFEPLGMTHSTFDQLPPGRLAQDLALSYRKTPGGLERIAFTFTQATPAGAMSSTAHDIALFMITLLDSGMYHGRRILTPASAARMLNAQYTPHPRVWGMTHGLAEYHLRGQRAAIMGGDLGGYACMMALFPEHRLGLFAVANAPDGVNLLDPFAERYFSAPPLEPVAPRPEFTGHLGRFAGTYRSNRYPRSDFTKMTGLTVQFPVRVGPDGVLNRWGTRWVEEDSLVFRRVDREEYMVFRQDKRGRIAQLVAWNGVFDRIAWYETAMFHMVVAVTFALAFSAPLVAALLRVVLRRPHASAARPRWLVGAGLALCATNVVFLVSLGVAFARARSLVDFPVWLAALLALPLSSLVGTLVLGIGTVRVSSLGIGSPRERVASLILFLVSGAFIAWLMYWNLLGIPR